MISLYFNTSLFITSVWDVATPAGRPLSKAHHHSCKSKSWSLSSSPESWESTSSLYNHHILGVRLNSKVFHSVDSFETTIMRCADRSLWDTFCQNNSTQCKSGPSKFYFNCAFLFVRINSIQWKSGPSRFYFNCAFFFFRNSPPSEIEFGALLPRPIIIPRKMLCFS